MYTGYWTLVWGCIMNIYKKRKVLPVTWAWRHCITVALQCHGVSNHRLLDCCCFVFFLVVFFGCFFVVVLFFCLFVFLSFKRISIKRNTKPRLALCEMIPPLLVDSRHKGIVMRKVFPLWEKPTATDSPHKGPVMWKAFPCHGATMAYHRFQWLTVTRCWRGKASKTWSSLVSWNKNFGGAFS